MWTTIMVKQLVTALFLTLSTQLFSAAHATNKLWDAIAANDTKALEAAVVQGADVRTPRNGKTPLLALMCRPDVKTNYDCVLALLNAGAPVTHRVFINIIARGCAEKWGVCGNVLPLLIEACDNPPSVTSLQKIALSHERAANGLPYTRGPYDFFVATGANKGMSRRHIRKTNFTEQQVALLAALPRNFVHDVAQIINGYVGVPFTRNGDVILNKHNPATMEGLQLIHPNQPYSPVRSMSYWKQWKAARDWDLKYMKLRDEQDKLEEQQAADK